MEEEQLLCLQQVYLHVIMLYIFISDVFPVMAIKRIYTHNAASLFRRIIKGPEHFFQLW